MWSRDPSSSREKSGNGLVYRGRRLYDCGVRLCDARGSFPTLFVVFGDMERISGGRCPGWCRRDRVGRRERCELLSHRGDGSGRMCAELGARRVHDDGSGDGWAVCSGRTGARSGDAGCRHARVRYAGFLHIVGLERVEAGRGVAAVFNRGECRACLRCTRIGKRWVSRHRLCGSDHVRIGVSGDGGGGDRHRGPGAGVRRPRGNGSRARADLGGGCDKEGRGVAGGLRCSWTKHAGARGEPFRVVGCRESRFRLEHHVESRVCASARPCLLPLEVRER